MAQSPEPITKSSVIGLGYFSVYVLDFERAIAFYSRVFGPPKASAASGRHHGWQMGNSWLTVFDGAVGASVAANPRNAEFALQVTTVAEVNALYDALIAAGGTAAMKPAGTEMYEPMYYGCLDDPFGLRIDVYCQLPAGCPLCAQLKSYESAFQKGGREDEATHLPAAFSDLVKHRDLAPGRGRDSWLMQCPHCDTHYLYRSDYEYLAGGSEDEQALERLTAAQVAALVPSSLAAKLTEAARDFAAGDRGLPLDEVMRKLLDRDKTE